MSQSVKVEKSTGEAVAQNTRSGWRLLGAYVLVQLGLILLKSHGLTRVAYWDWWKVTAITWGPWLMAVVCCGIVFIIRQASKLRK
jgi:hypothetical protein